MFFWAQRIIGVLDRNGAEHRCTADNGLVGAGTIAVIGSQAVRPIYGGGGSGAVSAGHNIISPLNGIYARLGIPVPAPPPSESLITKQNAGDSATTKLVIAAASDLVVTGGQVWRSIFHLGSVGPKILPIGYLLWDYLQGTSITNAGCPSGSISIRSGGNWGKKKHPVKSVATVAATLSPGSTVTGVSFSYAYTTGYRCVSLCLLLLLDVPLTSLLTFCF